MSFAPALRLAPCLRYVGIASLLGAVPLQEARAWGIGRSFHRGRDRAAPAHPHGGRQGARDPWRQHLARLGRGLARRRAQVAPENQQLALRRYPARTPASTCRSATARTVPPKAIAPSRPSSGPRSA